MINKTTGLMIASVFQVCILVAMLVSANLPLYFGAEIKIATKPVDPRSLFRGNFVLLDYNLSPIKTNLDFQKGEKIFITLKQKNGLSITNKAYKNTPNEQYIQCRVTKTIKDKVSFKCANIQAFFAPREKALKLEKELRESAVAVIMLDNKGKMALKDVVP